MAFLKKLFKSKNNKKVEHKHKPIDWDATRKFALNQLQKEREQFNQLEMQKKPLEPLSDEKLIMTFTEYFSPNKQFFSNPNSPEYNVYFEAINNARTEMLLHPALYKAATGRPHSELFEMLKNPKPGVTSALTCGQIFHMGKFATIQDAVLCVDFSELIPNCIALYLLLIAQRKPQDQRKQLIDAGAGTDKLPLKQAIDQLKILDPFWECRIH